ncbi:MAG: efflux RND transporter permease subunit, partial [Exilibacterium sp.]
KKTAPTAISHHNGHRELSVQYRLKSYAPSTGPGRVALEQHIQRTLHTIFKPKEYRLNTQVQNNTTKWSTAILLPVILLLFAVLAMAFESLTLPLLILLALPLTILGSVWALLISGNVGIMAIVGVVALLGLTINPAILLVDRMQQRVRRTNCGAGAAALIAVRERTRPVLMTSCTTIAGLWPLSLARGENLEIWPPFATVVMGGLVTSTLLTLLIIPVGFVLLSRLDRLFKRLGPQRLLVWLALNACAAVPIICYEVFDSVWWQLFLCSLIAGTSLRLMAGFYRDKHAVPDGGYSGFSGDTESDALTHPITVEVRYLSKIYAQVSPLTKFLTATRLNKLAPINTDKCAITHTTITYSLMAIASFYLESQMQNVIWQIVFFYITGAFVTQVAGHFLQYYGSSRRGYAFGETARRWLSAIAPWIILALLALSQTLIPIITGSSPRLTITTILLLALLTVFIQVGRKTAHRGQAQQPSTTQHQPGRIQRGWIQLCLILFSYGIPRTHQAVENLHFTVASGMIGVLGPNGAGKTTLLRLLANILVPTRGTIYYAGKEKRQWQELSSMIGYLPQEFGLPGHLTVRAYLEYYALLYRINTPQERKQRIDTLLQVGHCQNTAASTANYHRRRTDYRTRPQRAHSLSQPANKDGQNSNRHIFHAHYRGCCSCL